MAPKIAAVALITRTLIGPFGELFAQWQQIIIFMAIASMLVGALAAIWQTNIKRLMAYSSIGHVGFALVGLAAGTEEGIRGIAIYMAIYLAMNIGAFCCILSMRRQGRLVRRPRGPQQCSGAGSGPRGGVGVLGRVGGWRMGRCVLVRVGVRRGAGAGVKKQKRECPQGVSARGCQRDVQLHVYGI